MELFIPLSIPLIRNYIVIQLSTSATDNITTSTIASVESQSVDIARLLYGFSFLAMSAAHQIVQANLAIFHLHSSGNIISFTPPGHIVTAN